MATTPEYHEATNGTVEKWSGTFQWEKRDSRLDNFPMMSTLWPTIGVTVLYALGAGILLRAPISIRLTLSFKCWVVFHDATLFVIYLFILTISLWNYRGSSDEGAILWDPDPHSKSYGIMVAYYMFYLARILSLFDTFIYILQKKPMDAIRVVSGVFNGIGPTWVWSTARFGNIPGHDFDLVLYAWTFCLVYLFYFLVTAGFRRYRRYKQHLTTWQLALILLTIMRRCCAMAFGGYNGIQWFSTLLFCVLLIGHMYLYFSLYVSIDERLFVI